ncbi:hypothetical protein Pla100_30360 [Neorhodopirellula pilleata]|uniref:Uncharacterized protein n=1 Tax=Neorhodopirellula pilleata TaxID=2714738 RepID=A0A5C6AE94_9BACT|nr:hypothetical protein Pla100_30360 [Neorhodopirellula pilleata]
MLSDTLATSTRLNGGFNLIAKEGRNCRTVKVCHPSQTLRFVLIHRAVPDITAGDRYPVGVGMVAVQAGILIDAASSLMLPISFR